VSSQGNCISKLCGSFDAFNLQFPQKFAYIRLARKNGNSCRLNSIYGCVNHKISLQFRINFFLFVLIAFHITAHTHRKWKIHFACTFFSGCKVNLGKVYVNWFFLFPFSLSVCVCVCAQRKLQKYLAKVYFIHLLCSRTSDRRKRDGWYAKDDKKIVFCKTI
jgi:hypothetical protein